MAAAVVSSPAEVLEIVQHSDQNLALVQLAVGTITGKEVLQETSFPATATVANIKEMLRAATGFPEYHQKLVWQNSILEDGVVLGELLPPKGALLQLIVSQPPREDLEQVRSVVQGAAAALNGVSVHELNELRRMNKPPGGVCQVFESVMYLLADVGQVPAIVLDSRGRLKDASWEQARKMMSNPKAFLLRLHGLKAQVENGQVPQRNFDAVQRIRNAMGLDFSVHEMARKSRAAAGLISWLMNILMYHEVMQRLRSEFEDFDNIMAELSEELGQ